MQTKCLTFKFDNTRGRGTKSERHASWLFKNQSFSNALTTTGDQSNQPLVPCFWCDTHLTRAEATCDHIKSACRGGKTIPDNLVISCRTCNEARGVVNILAGRFRIVYQNKRNIPFGVRRYLIIELIRERNKLLDDLLELESIYYRKLAGRQRQLRDCLKELDELLRAEVL